MCERAQSEEPTHLSVLLSFKNGLHNFLHTEIFFSSIDSVLKLNVTKCVSGIPSGCQNFSIQVMTDLSGPLFAKIISRRETKTKS